MTQQEENEEVITKDIENPILVEGGQVGFRPSIFKYHDTSVLGNCTTVILLTTTKYDSKA